jgi:hypothetical protein
VKRILFSAVLIFITVACEKKVAKVGDTTITSKDISYRARVSEIYYPDSGKEYIALSQLIKGYLAEEVLKSLGYKIDDNVIDSESRRIDANTKAPDVLNAIKKVYGNNKGAYNKTFVRIVYAERFLYNEVFLKSSSIHKKEIEEAKEFLNRVRRSPAEFSKIAGDMKLSSRKLIISREKGIKDAEKEREFEHSSGPQGVEQAEFIIEKIKNVDPGNVYPEIIEWQEGYQIVRVVKRRSNEYRLESVSIPKRDYDEWFWSIAGDVPVWIYDRGLKDELIKNVSWVQKVNLR